MYLLLVLAFAFRIGSYFIIIYNYYWHLLRNLCKLTVTWKIDFHYFSIDYLLTIHDSANTRSRKMYLILTTRSVILNLLNVKCICLWIGIIEAVGESMI